MDVMDELAQFVVPAVPGRWFPLSPRIKAAGGDSQQIAHRGDRMLGPVVLYEFEDPLFVVGFVS